MYVSVVLKIIIFSKINTYKFYLTNLYFFGLISFEILQNTQAKNFVDKNYSEDFERKGKKKWNKKLIEIE